MRLTPRQIAGFQDTVWEYYREYGRSMPWRDNPSPYNVLVSEIMLQQTQVPRVVPKFIGFMVQFPTVQALAAAPLADVLACWSGLGYNRRAKYLWEAAQAIVTHYGGNIPAELDALVSLPGVGPNTAGAILAYAFDQPAVFVETNIRTVIIHHFFEDTSQAVRDTEIKSVVQQTLPSQSPREWYWALMDYGTHLKNALGSGTQRVHGYKKQSKFEGSRRQVRGAVLRALIESSQSTEQLRAAIGDERVPGVLGQLCAEGLVARTKTMWHLTGDER